MEITFLGTASGTPTRTRNVSALAIQRVNQRAWCLVDCGEGTQHRLLATRYSLQTLAAVFITHVHGDHVYGLPGLLASAQLGGRSAPLTLVAPPGVRELIDAVVAHTGLHLGFTLDWRLPQAEEPVWAGADFGVGAIPLSHRVASWAYRFEARGPSGALLQDKLLAAGVPAGPRWARLKAGETLHLDDGRVLQPADFLAPAPPSRVLIVAGDNDTPELLREACQGAAVLVHEATYTQDVLDRVGPAPQHSSARRVARFAQSVALPQLVLTHFSPRYHDAPDASPSIEDIRREAAADYRGRLFLASDYACYRLGRAGDLIELAPVAGLPQT